MDFFLIISIWMKIVIVEKRTNMLYVLARSTILQHTQTIFINYHYYSNIFEPLQLWIIVLC